MPREHDKRGGIDFFQMPKTKTTAITSEQKMQAKKKFCDSLELGSDQAFLCVIELPKMTKQGLDDFALLCQGLKELPTTFVFRAYPSQTMDIAQKVQNAPRFRVVSGDIDNRSAHALAADLWVFYPGKENTLQRIFTVMQSGAVPVLIPPEETAHLFHDYSPQREQGNSFILRQVTPWSVFAAIVRAQENNAFPYDWGLLRRAVSKFVV